MFHYAQNWQSQKITSGQYVTRMQIAHYAQLMRLTLTTLTIEMLQSIHQRIMNSRA